MSDVRVDWTPPGPGPWMQDRSHLPSAVTPLMQSTYPPGMQRGFAEALAGFGSLLDMMNIRFVNGFIFMQPVPFDAPGRDGPCLLYTSDAADE